MSTKVDHLADPNSCMGRAAEDEPVFVLRAKDLCAAAVVRFWANMASEVHDPGKVADARAVADAMDKYRDERWPEKGDVLRTLVRVRPFHQP